MRNSKLMPVRMLLPLICALVASSCATSGGAKQQCPRLAPVPPSLMQPSNAGSTVRDVLLEPQTPATRK